MNQLKLINMMEYIHLKDAELMFFPDFFSFDESQAFFDHFLNEISLEQGEIILFGKRYKTPRLEGLFSDENLNYSYSGQHLIGNPLTPLLREIKSKIEEKCGYIFNCVLVNLYRDGQDSNGWHADNEPELGPDPIIASISLGAVRRFDLKHNQSGEVFQLYLPAGSLLIMGKGSQIHWKHQLPKSKKIKTPRVNLTFRYIHQ